MINIKNKFIPLTYDFMFKEIFGSKRSINITTYFLARYLNIDYEKLKGKVQILEKELSIENKYDKKQSVDLIVELEDQIINIELNMRNYKYLINRNFGYLCRIYGNQISKNETYIDYKKVVQINFDNFSIKGKRKVKREYVLISNDEERVEYEKLIEIHHIDMEYCKEICYNKINQDFTLEWVRLLNCQTMEEIREMVGEVIMNEEVREDFVVRVGNLNRDIKLMGLYDREHHEEQVRIGELMLAEERGIEEGIKVGINQGIQTGKKQGIKEGINQGIQTGKKQGMNQKTNETIKRMIEEGMTDEMIIKIMEVNQDKINQVKNNNLEVF